MNRMAWPDRSGACGRAPQVSLLAPDRGFREQLTPTHLLQAPREEGWAEVWPLVWRVQAMCLPAWDNFG